MTEASISNSSQSSTTDSEAPVLEEHRTDRGTDRTRKRGWAIGLAVLFLIPVPVLLVLRILDVPSGVTDTLVAFTPYALPCGLLACLLALVGRARLLALISAALLVPHLWWLAPMYVANGPTVRGYGTTVMSVNLKYGHGDPRQVVDLVRDREVEILSVQELTPEAVSGLREAGLERLLPHHHIEAVEGSPKGSGIWSARPVTPEEFGNQRRTTFANLRATVQTRGGVEVDLMAVHPAPPLPARSESWRRDIGELVRVGVPEDRPMIMAGDFNATRDHGPMRQLAGQGMADAADQAGAGYVGTWGWGTLPRMFEIDHVLVSDDDINAIEVTRHAIRGSDHAAVVAELTISDLTGNNPS